MYYLIVTDRYNLWTKGPYSGFAAAQEMAMKMIEEDTNGTVTKVTVAEAIGTASMNDKTARWELSGDGTT